MSIDTESVTLHVPSAAGGLSESTPARPRLEQQPARSTVFVGVEVGRLPPVFGTAQPPRGLSGLIRKRAYAIPEHHAAHWMLLLLGDRVDVWEGRLRRHPLLTAVLVASLASGIGFGRRRAQARRGRRMMKRLRGLLG